MKKEPKCKNCLLFNKEKETCMVSIIIDGEKINMPVSPEDNCHMDELGIPVHQVRWWVEDPKTGKQTKENGVVKIEYPDNFFRS